jgi:hypothetical protein
MTFILPLGPIHIRKHHITYSFLITHNQDYVYPYTINENLIHYEFFQSHYKTVGIYIFYTVIGPNRDSKLINIFICYNGSLYHIHTHNLMYQPAAHVKDFNYWRQKSSGYTMKSEGSWTWLILGLLNDATLTTDVIHHCTRWQYDNIKWIQVTQEVVIMASPSFPWICLRKLWKFSMRTADTPIKVWTRYIRNTVRNTVKITGGLETQYKHLTSLARWYKSIQFTQSNNEIKIKGKDLQEGQQCIQWTEWG